MFTTDNIAGLEWQQEVPRQTPQRLYRVSITWELDRYRITVLDIASGHLLRRVHAWYPRTAVATANRLLRKYTNLEPLLEDDWTRHYDVERDHKSYQ
jgi:hypothetical protein